MTASGHLFLDQKGREVFLFFFSEINYDVEI